LDVRRRTFDVRGRSPASPDILNLSIAFLRSTFSVRLLTIFTVICIGLTPALAQPPALDPPPAESLFAQPPVRSPARQTPPPGSFFSFGNIVSAARGRSIIRTPEMFGDSLYPLPTITAMEGLSGGGSMTLVSDLPLAAAAGRTLVAEHNKAVPTNRLYFNYNYYHNALESRISGISALTAAPFLVQRDDSLSGYLIGAERMFAGGAWSAELRMPLAGSYDFAFEPGIAGLSERGAVHGGEVGNLAIIFKRVLYENDATVFSAGVGVAMPTGDDVRVETALTRYTLHNEAVYLLPYLAVIRNADDLFFWHGFLQLDVPTEGNTLSFQSLPPDVAAAGDFGKLTDQTLLRIDAGGGVWLTRRPQAPLVTGVAAVAEVHYTDTLQNTDFVAFSRPSVISPSIVDLRNAANWMNVVNVTSGLHIELFNNSTLRIAGAFPLLQRDDRFFDGELLVQFGQRY
jgi:hypothetical protein